VALINWDDFPVSKHSSHKSNKIWLALFVSTMISFLPGIDVPL
jgi:hypothetical protein